MVIEYSYARISLISSYIITNKNARGQKVF